MTQEEFNAAQKLRIRRMGLYLTQEWIAVHLNTSHSYISKFERGEILKPLRTNFIRDYDDLLTKCENGEIEVKRAKRTHWTPINASEQLTFTPERETAPVDQSSEHDILSHYAVNLYTALKMIRFAMNLPNKSEALNELSLSVNNLMSDIDNALKTHRERSITK